MTSGVQESVGGALAIAGVSTLGDFLWASVLPRPHPAAYGLIHGGILFLCIGLILGTPAGRRGLGAIGGVVIGALGAAGFYLMAPVAGYSVLFVLWVAVWIALGVLNERLNRQPKVRAAFARGMLAAVASGVAFYLISGIWFPFHPRGWDYLVHFGAWTLAYFPGFAALLVARRPA